MYLLEEYKVWHFGTYTQGSDSCYSDMPQCDTFLYGVYCVIVVGSFGGFGIHVHSSWRWLGCFFVYRSLIVQFFKEFI